MTKVLISKLHSVFSKVAQNILNMSYMTPKEVCAFLRISSVTLWRNTKKGILTSYAIGGKRLYLKDEVISSLVELKPICDERK